jgi:hypothetical protein
MFLYSSASVGLVRYPRPERLIKVKGESGDDYTQLSANLGDSRVVGWLCATLQGSIVTSLILMLWSLYLNVIKPHDVVQSWLDNCMHTAYGSRLW